MKKVWGCDGETQMATPTFGDETPELAIYYYSCPVRFIPSSVYDFLAEYDYMKKFVGSPIPRYSDLSPRFRQAMVQFENCLNEFSTVEE